MTKTFDPKLFKNLYQPPVYSSGEDNGQVTIIGGSALFHGAPLLSLSVASRIVDMVFFTSPAPSVGKVSENIKSKLFSFIWVPFDEVEKYIEKSDAILIGPGFMRFKSEKVPHGERHHICDEACQISKSITKRLLTSFPNKKWVIDGGSLQVMESEWIPKNAIITPNYKEFEMLFDLRFKIQELRMEKLEELVNEKAKEYAFVIVLKGPTTLVSNGEEIIQVKGGNPGLTKGGTGDVLAGLTVALLAKNDPMLAACSASYVIKYAADELYKEVGTNYNADDVARRIPQAFNKLLN